MVHTPGLNPVPEAQCPPPLIMRRGERTAASSPSSIRARRVGAVVWLLVPPLLFSALVHTADPDVGGIQGLSRPGVLVSVAVWAAPMAALALVSLWMRVRTGLLAFLAAALALAIVPGWFLFVMGSTAATPLARVWSFVGITALCLVTLVLAVLPAGVFGWPQRPAPRNR